MMMTGWARGFSLGGGFITELLSELQDEPDKILDQFLAQHKEAVGRKEKIEREILGNTSESVKPLKPESGLRKIISEFFAETKKNYGFVPEFLRQLVALDPAALQTYRSVEQRVNNGFDVLPKRYSILIQIALAWLYGTSELIKTIIHRARSEKVSEQEIREALWIAASYFGNTTWTGGFFRSTLPEEWETLTGGPGTLPVAKAPSDSSEIVRISETDREKIKRIKELVDSLE